MFKYINRFKTNTQSLMIFVCFFLLLSFSIYSNLSHLTLRNAVGGFSPVDYVNRLVEPGNYINNFENGISILKTSLMFQLYEIANSIGIEPELFQRFAIVGGVIFFALSLWLFTKSLVPKKSWYLPYLTILFGLATGVLNHNLARFGSFAGLHYGQMYTPAAICAIFAFVFAFQGATIFCAIIIGVTFCFHPVVGILSGIICAFMILSLPGELKNKSTWIGCGIALFIVLFWYGTFIHSATDVEQLSFKTWIDWVRFGNCHWFPFSLEVFGDEHAKRITPMFAILLLSLARMKYEPLPDRIRRLWYTALIATLFLTCIGLGVSLYPLSPMLVKLAMHRASKFILLLCLPLALDLLLEDIKSDNIPRAFLAWICLLTPMIGLGNPYIKIVDGGYGFPLLYSIFRFGLAWWHSFKKTSVVGGDLLLPVGALGMSFYLIYSGHALWSDPAFVSQASLLILSGVLTGVVQVFKCSKQASLREISSVIPILICSFLALFSLVYKADQMLPRFGKAKSLAYLEAQYWAEHNTKPDALFITDPNIAYGWRDYSQRASFGTIREWAHSGWLYSGSKHQFEEGMRRVRILGIEPQNYLNESLKNGKRSVGAQWTKFINDCRERYYSLQTEQLVSLSKNEKIDYFIFDKGYESVRRLSPVFENKYFVICTSHIIDLQKQTLK